MPPSIKEQHVLALQSLRGIAAIVVVLHHCSFVFATTSTVRTVSEIIFNAHAAVIVFFVLSGYVLSRSLSAVAVNLHSAVGFYCRRAFRIYPAIWLATGVAVLSVLLLQVGRPPAYESAWFSEGYSKTSVGFFETLKNVVLLKTTILRPAWSARVEVIESALMPFIWLGVASGFGALIAAAFGIAALVWSNTPLLAYTYAFICGACIFRYQEVLPQWVSSRLAGLAALLILLLFRRVDPGWQFEINYNAVVPTIVEATSGALLIAFLARNKKGGAWMTSRPLVFLGDISFSVYLFHYPIMAMLAKLPVFESLPVGVSAGILMVVTVLVVIPISVVSYRLVEIPGMQLGRIFVEKFTRRERKLLSR